ncbi:hypothetical protein AB0D49_30890 [Streptomyces sp. NPDC048290]|uniref:hypothetical protein n=1 Tax=Streptomyces sp. NPDC048290 TaxID=3155811 RepID=UPI0034418A51
MSDMLSPENGGRVVEGVIVPWRTVFVPWWTVFVPWRTVFVPWWTVIVRGGR